MRDLKIERYPDTCVTSLPDSDQHAILLSIKACLDAGVPAYDVLGKILSLEGDKDTCQAWTCAINDLSQGNSSFCEVLARTGLFSHEIKTILLITTDFMVALPAISEYLKVPKERT